MVLWLAERIGGCCSKGFRALPGWRREAWAWRFWTRHRWTSRTSKARRHPAAVVWRLAAAGRSFYTVPHDHFNCALGAHTHNIPLSSGREEETGQTLQMMFDLGYMKPE